MTGRCLLVLALRFAATFSAGCTERNKAFCGDGICIDPALPFCDIDGQIAGTPDTCIAVDCAPMELEVCRGDVAITCNATGTNFEQAQCPLGCDVEASGCRQCTDDVQCGEATPICEMSSGSCRRCLADDECASRVCDFETGACVAETSIVYASTDDFGSCSLSQPCPLNQAITLATNTSPTPIVRMLPGTYTSSLQVTNPTARPLEVVATGATIAVIGNVAAVVVKDGASVDLRDLDSTSEAHIQCGNAGAPISSLTIADGDFVSIGSATAIEVNRCKLVMKVIALELASGTPLALLEDATLDADRFRVDGNNPSTIVLGNSKRVDARFTNSLFDKVNVFGFLADDAEPGTRLLFVNSTFILDRSFQVCKSSTIPFFSMTFENSILSAQGGFDAVENPNPANCTFVSTMLSRQMGTPPAGTIVADPLFVDVAGKDFHLQASSPAVDAATPGSVTIEHDLDGVARPQGVASDLGAFERPL